LAILTEVPILIDADRVF